MPSITLAQAASLALPHVYPGLIENDPVLNQLVRLLPWKPIRGYEDRVPGVTDANLGPIDSLAAGAAVPEGSAIPTLPAPAYPLKRLVRDIILDSVLIETMSDVMDLVAVQIDGALQAMLYRLGDALINGDLAATLVEFNGFKNLASAGQTTGAGNSAPNGAPPTLQDFNRLLDKITVRNGRADFLLMNSATIRTWRALHYDAGLALQVGWLCGGHVNTETDLPAIPVCPEAQPILMHRGVPILVSDHIRSDEAKGAGVGLTSAYAGALGDGDGLCFTFPARSGTAPFKVTHIVNPEGDQERFRVTANVGLSLYSLGALARLDGIDN